MRYDIKMSKSKVIALSVPEWVIDDILGNVKNRSGRILELLIKGHMYEKDKQNEANTKGTKCSLLYSTYRNIADFLRLTLKSPIHTKLFYNHYIQGK